ncbi:cytochrome-c peroxidase [Pontibacter qinzhouensis]|uniref:Cytochrome-c peroxidase n=1 Tax=Pontibacter qinzhouensis TaxID=2603253 RepID=A0A5C8K7D5_9BACT|nr:cytochrome c peroxidase [Pontibacter qinzhouensis]TXK46936.1 cytochrome-c peroxidase [Pontibacter qinzhouensis]
MSVGSIGKWLWVALLLVACTPQQEPEEQVRAKRYDLQVPANFPLPEYSAYNPLSEEGVELGRMLFYDKRLSGNNQLSCASCHHQELAFTDGHSSSKRGATGEQLLRHSPGLANMAWMEGLFWDGGSKNLESQAFGPITAPDEMNQNLQELVSELQAVPAYVDKFREVFNDDIKSAYIGRALAQFQRTLVSANSRYDKYMRQEPGGQLSDLELQGLHVVEQKCGSCHTAPLFTDNHYHNNGLDSDFSRDDFERIYQGRFRITHNPADVGKFKTPTLRNILLTAPYMHDGRFKTIEEVLEHYTKGVQQSPTLDAAFKNTATRETGLTLTPSEKKAILAFLETLTDDEFIQDKKFASPFVD